MAGDREHDTEELPNRATCVAHRLVYDPSRHAGCVLCVRGAQAQATPRAEPSRAGAWLALVGGLCACGLIVVWVQLRLSHRFEPSEDALMHAATAPASTLAPARAPLRVLFIGNSLTAVNDLPAMIARLAKAAGEQRAFEPRSKTVGGAGLKDHLAAGYVPPLLSEAAWDAVVLQDQGQTPALPPADREVLFFAPLRQLDAMIRSAGSHIVLYETFGRREGGFKGDEYAAMQRRLDDGYNRAAIELKAELVPVGAVWERALHTQPNLQLWADDGLHPTPAGTYLAACAFYTHFYRHSPAGNPYRAELNDADALAIQKLAAETVLGYTPHVEEVATQAPPPPVIATPPVSSEPAPSEAEAEDRFRHQNVVGAMHDRAARAARERVPIVLYVKADCPSCEEAKAYLSVRTLSLQIRDVGQDAQAAAAVQRVNPRGSVPTLEVDGDAVVGWDEARFEKALDAAVRKRIGEDLPAPPSGNGTIVIEGESLLPAADASAFVSLQRNCCGVTWSGNAQLFVQGGKAGDDALFNLQVPAAGSYEISAVLTQAGDYGIVELKLDGEKLGTFDGYVPDAVRTAPLSLGVTRLTRGSHALVLAVTGKHPASAGYFAGLDVLRLRPLRR